MSKHNPRHPGVQVYLKGSSFCVRFKQDGFDKRKGLGTTDAAIAEGHAALIHRILTGQPYDYAEMPEAVRNALKLQSPDVTQAIDAAIEALPDNVPDDREFTETELSAYDRCICLQEKLEEARGRIKRLQEDNEACRKKIAAYEAILVASGNAQLKKIKPLKLSEATTQYLEHGTGAGERTQSEYRNYLNQFSAYIGKDKLISSIEPLEVIAYLEKLKKSIGYIPTLRKVCYIICAMLESESGGLYPVRPVKEWRKRNCKTDGKSDDNFYWIDESDVKRLASQVKNDSGEYWHDCVLVQFGLALRPEEIPMLLCKEFDLEKRTVHICPIIYKEGNKDVVVRRLKTNGSKATLNLSDSLVALLNQRPMNTFVLFPRNDKVLGLRTEKRGSAFELEHALWKPTAFCKHYLKTLRGAAKKIGLDEKRIDSRTLRRSRGRDLILKLQSAEKAATFLRDNVETVRKYYSRLLPKDVSAN